MATWLIEYNTPEYKAFEDGWKKWVEHTTYANLYWHPRVVAWAIFDPSKNDIKDLGVPAVAVASYSSPTLLWPDILRTWGIIKLEHPDAIWSPHTGGWSTFADRTAPAPPPTPAWGPREQALHEELLHIEQLYTRGEIDAVTRLRMRDEALRRYQEGVAAPG